MARYHDIFRYVCDDIRPSERSIQRYRREYGRYFEVLLQMTLKKAFDEGFTEFNLVAIGGTIKKAYNSNNNQSQKKKHNYWLITANDVQLVPKALKNSINLQKNRYYLLKSDIIIISCR